MRGYQHFYAEHDGALKSVVGEVAVTDTLVIDSDVGLDTGNLEYPGEVVVKGGVGQGCTAKAGSNVFVFGSVDAGATIVAGGDVVIGQGIAGRRTRVVARGQVRTGYIHEARVRAGGDILVGNHIVQAILHADGVISVEEREGPRGGSISGGEVWGLAGPPAYSRLVAAQPHLSDRRSRPGRRQEARPAQSQTDGEQQAYRAAPEPLQPAETRREGDSTTPVRLYGTSEESAGPRRQAAGGR